MKTTHLLLRSVAYYWRTNVAVVLGVAVAVAVLAGALLVGDSVRGTLRDLVLQRLGKTDQVVISNGFFRAQLADDIRQAPEFADRFTGITPMIAVRGFVTEQASGTRAGQVDVNGVDDRFWQFHGITGVSGPAGRDALISTALSQELNTKEGATLIVRVQRPTDVPLESLHSRKDDLGRTIRLTVRTVLSPEQLGEFSLQARQGDVRAVFVPLSLIQSALATPGNVNTLLVSGNNATPSALEQLVRKKTTLDDFGLKVTKLSDRNSVALQNAGGLLNDAAGAAAVQASNDISLSPQPVFTYLANSIRAGSREVPYSLIAAMDIPEVTPMPGQQQSAPGMLLNEWAARDLKAVKGDTVTIEYYVWEDPGRLATRTMDFTMAGIVPLDTRDRDLAPVYPGITDSISIVNWDPPFPVDLRRIRPIDEEYWKLHRTTPKAFIHFSVGYQLWKSRYGSVTSVRVTPTPGRQLDEVHAAFADHVRSKLDPFKMGFSVQDVRTQSLQASQGATNFGEYFVYFSFFLVISALLLTSLFFKLSVEQRVREIGLLRSVGFKAPDVRLLFMGEGLLLSIAGASIGVLGGLAYANLLTWALRTWWVGAIGTSALTLHVSWSSAVIGAIAGIAASMICIWITLRGLSRISERSLLAGQLASDIWESGAQPGSPRARFAAILFAVLGIALIAATATGRMDRAGAFFGAGFAMLAACLCFFLVWLRRPHRQVIEEHSSKPVFHLGVRNAMYRPMRSVLSMAMIAAATFILISVDAFRKDGGAASYDPHSGTGGYSLLVESLFPIVHNPATREGRASLGLEALDDTVKIDAFRVRPGDDASCLNLYAPTNPRILAPIDTFFGADRFRFQETLASTEVERANPWMLLHRQEPDGAVPVIADANSMTYVLHHKLGDDMVITHGDRSTRLRFVAALSDSIFQGELLMSQANFLKLFPEQAGYQVLLVQAPQERAASVSKVLEDALTDFGADATSTAERLASFHRVENTYLSTFQMLGGLGLLLGTVGLGAVMLRNVLERRRELALLRALGYKEAHFFTLVIAENALLLAGGLLIGTACALLAIAPVLAERGGRVPVVSVALILMALMASGGITSVFATNAAIRSSLVTTLRSE